MKAFNKKLLAATMLASFVFGASAARANLLVEYSTNGGVSYTTAYSGSGTSVPFTGSLPNGISITTGQVTTNAPGTAALGTVTGGTFSISNSSATTESLIVVIGSSGFTMPSNPGILRGSISITDNGPASLALGSTVSEYACAFSNGGNATNCIGGASTTATNTVIDTATSGSFSGNSSINASAITTPYEIADVISLTLVAGADFAVTTAASVAVPEPASIALLGFGLLGLATFARRRTNTQV